MTNLNAQDALLQLPGQIRKMELDLWKNKQQLDAARMRAKMRAADVAFAVADAKGEDGKPKFSNADKREAATQARLEADPEHRAILRELDEQAAVVVRIEAALGYLRDTQRNARVLLLARSPTELVFPAEDLGVTPAPAGGPAA